jgi:hypothetical protein
MWYNRQAGIQSDLVISPQVLQNCTPKGLNGEEGKGEPFFILVTSFILSGGEWREMEENLSIHLTKNCSLPLWGVSL